jgi:hypothetical protein
MLSEAWLEELLTRLSGSHDGEALGSGWITLSSTLGLPSAARACRHTHAG